MYRDLKEMLFPFLAISAAILALVSVFIGIFAAVDYADCWGFESATGIETKWRLQCYAKRQDGVWVPQKYVFGNATELRIK